MHSYRRSGNQWEVIFTYSSSSNRSMKFFILEQDAIDLVWKLNGGSQVTVNSGGGSAPATTGALLAVTT